MATANKFNQFVEDAFHGVHDLGSDQLRVALTNSSNVPAATDAVVANLTQISYTNLTGGSPSVRHLTTSASAQTTGTYKLTINDLVLSASGGPVATFRYIVIYNDTPSSPLDPLIVWYDYTTDLTLQDGEQLTIDFSAANGLLQAS